MCLSFRRSFCPVNNRCSLCGDRAPWQAPQSPPDGDYSTVCSWAHGPSLGVRIPVPCKLLYVGPESPLSRHVANSAKCLISQSNFSSNAPSALSGFLSYQAGNCGPNLRCSLGSHRDPQRWRDFHLKCRPPLHEGRGAPEGFSQAPRFTVSLWLATHWPELVPSPPGRAGSATRPPQEEERHS